VDNLVHGIFLAATKPAIDREIFLLGDEERVTWADLYRPVAEALGYTLAILPEGHFTEQRASWFERLEPVRMSRLAQGLLSIFPHRLRLAAFLAYQAILEPQTDNSSPIQLQSSHPVLSRERSLLYSCQYKLPYQKAARMLGYHPPIAFPEAMRRTIAWLGFARYPVKEECMEVTLQL
jgi:nucleoside-diphosphate-sugar epimerase